MLDLPDFLTRDPRFGQIDLTGHRIGLEHVVYYHNLGETAEQLVDRFPTLMVGQVQQVLDFYLANREAVDAYVADHEAEMARQRAAYKGPTRDEVIARLRKQRTETA